MTGQRPHTLVAPPGERLRGNGHASPLVSLSHRLREQAQQSGDRPAVIDSGHSVTYQELFARVDRVSAWLSSRGLKSDEIVAISMPRSADAIAAILGVWQIGAGYLPLDPSYPAERLRLMLADAKPVVFIADDALAKRFAEFEAAPFSQVVNGVLPTLDFDVADCDDDLGYVLFTSGSTGRPKGVAMPRGPLRHLIEWQLRNTQAKTGDATLQFAPLSFDVSFQEIFSTLAGGGTLILPTEAERRDPRAMLDVIRQRGVSRLFLPMVALQQLVDAEPEAPACLREIITAGEQLRVTHALRRFFDRPGLVLWNHYGPTETHVVTAHRLEAPTTDWPVLPPIGRPIDGVRIELLPLADRPGEEGEIAIGGECLARGYLQQPERTAERFVNSPEGRLYRTGDVGRWNAAGELEFLGRSDDQVKIRGFRIEPGEIEAAMCAVVGVREAAVVARDANGEKRLIGYYLADTSITPSAIRDQLAKKLPEFMVPSVLVPLARFPLTPSGKIDRRALPVPSRDRPALSAPYVAPHTPREKQIAAIWCDVLQLDEVGVHDPFFDLGGHSLALARVHARLRDAHQIAVPITSLFQHATIAALAAAIDAPQSEVGLARAAPTRRRTKTDAIAIVGLAGRFPGASNVDEFWRNICDGVESVRHFSDDELIAAGVDPDQLRSPDFVKARAILDEADRFDAAFFGFQPREAELTDPQHRLFLEAAWTALENAGHPPEKCPGRVGVFAGSSLNTYLLNNVLPDRGAVEHFVGEFQSGGYNVLVGNDKDYLATRVAYKFNLRGPAVAVQTACSTSLVAVCQAVESLRAGECDIALAGGVSISFPQVRGSIYQEGAIAAPDGRCRPFDAEAKGTVFGEGVGVVVLRPLDDAIADGDTIYAVIRGVGLSNDGSDKVSYLAPSVAGQVEAIARALDQAGFEPRTVGYVEAHGTGTPLGDPIEVAALARVFDGGASPAWCRLGSVKANVGHLEAAAGVTGLIKSALAVYHGVIPPTLHFRRPNPALALERSPFRVADKLEEWTEHPRRAGVSSLGVGGTNAHVALEEPPHASESGEAWPSQVFVFSARTPGAVENSAQRFAEFARANPAVNFADAAYTLQVGRRAMEYRRALVAGSAQEFAEACREAKTIGPVAAAPRVAFLFPGQGAQRIRMAAGLYEAEPTFRAQLDLCSETLRGCLGLDLRALIFTGDERLHETQYTQPALFAVEYSLAQTLIGWGITPDVSFGHSIGEYVAACLAGVFTLESALCLVAERGRLVQSTPAGVMLAVRTSEAELVPLIEGVADLAAVNGPRQCVISGPDSVISDLEKRLGAQAITCKRLTTSHAFHSRLLDPILAEFRSAVEQAKPARSNGRFLSCVSGNWIGEESASPDYWVRQLRGTVRAADALEKLVKDHQLLEVGPGRTLAGMARQVGGRVVESLPRSPEHDLADILAALGQLWCAGVEVDWKRFHALSPRRRVPLPTYPFERKRYFIEAPPRVGSSRPAQPSVECSAESLPPAPSKSAEPTAGGVLADLQSVFADLAGTSSDTIEPTASFFELGFDSLFLTQAVQAIQSKFGVRVSFRQLLEDLSTPKRLADHIDRAGPKAAAAVIAAPAVETKPEPVAFGAFTPVDTRDEVDWSPRQRRFVADLVRRTVQRTRRSKQHVQEHRAAHADPRTVSGFTKTWKEMVYPVVIERSVGSRLWDIDGNEYIDLLNGFGPDLLGHSPPFVVEAVSKQLQAGYEVGPMSPLAGELAKLVCELTGMDRASFVCTGSEAVQAALRAARTFTGRERVATFGRDYHGNFDEVLLRPNAGDGSRPPTPSAPGVPRAAVSNMIVLDYGSDEALRTIRQLGQELAAVLIEPVQSRRPELQPREFLHKLRAITEETGALFIFDEVITGFRLHPGGAQTFFDVRADLATYGKVIGGGMPIGAVAGRSKFMDVFDGGYWAFGDDSFPTAGRTFFAGTFVRHPLALAAGLAALTHLKKEGPALQDRLNAMAVTFVAELNAICRANSVPLEVVHCGSVMYFRVLEGSKEAGLLFYLLRERGVYLLEGFPSYLSTAHTDADLTKIIGAFRDSVAAMRQAGFFGAAISELAEDYVPLTEAQTEVWLASQASEDASRAFNETCSIRMRGTLDVARFRAAADTLISRHDALRAEFDPGGAGQRFKATVPIDVPLVDLSHLPAQERERQLLDLREAEDRRAFDLAGGPLIRWTLIRLAADDHAALLTVHHIACDGWSYDVLLHELGQLLTVSTVELAPAETFAEYARAELDRGGDTPELRYWRREFAEPPLPLMLPTDQPRPIRRSFAGARLSKRLGGELTNRVRSAAARLQVTPYAFLLTAFDCLINRLTGQGDFVVGIPTSGQALAGAKSLVGHCVNFLPFRQKVLADDTFAVLASRVRMKLLDALEHQAFSSVSLQRALPDADLPPIAVGFNLDPALGDLGFSGLLVEVAKNPKHFVNLDLHWNLVDEEAELVLECEFNTDLWSAATVEHWAESFQVLLESAAADSNVAVVAMPLVTPSEARRLVVESNRTAVEYPNQSCVHELFERVADAAPKAIALVFDGGSLTYSELNRHANRLARVLRRHEVSADTPVAVALPRGPDLIVALLAVLKASGAYLPLDQSHPQARQTELLRDAGVRVLLGTSQTEAKAGVTVIDVTKEIAGDDSNLPSTTKPDHLAAVMYTSGSTGKPKGVMVTHRAMARLLFGVDYCHFGPEHTFAQLAPVAFDAATFEIWGALLHGGRLALYPNAVPDPTDLGPFLRRHAVDTLWLTAGLFNAVIDHDPTALAGITQLLTGGEAMSVAHARRALAALPRTRIVNGYGPTETTTFAATYTLPRPLPDGIASVPIGRPIGNTSVLVLDDQLQLAPAGAVGELFIGGPGVARGYINDPELTAQRFVRSPFSDLPGVLYRTGDRVRWRPEGVLEYLGRADRQVKIRGHRIDPGEVEVALASHPQVATSVVDVQGTGSDARLVAYVVPRTVGELDVERLRTHLAERLPAYLIPSALVSLDAIPLTPNGKLDRERLPQAEPSSINTRRERVAPRIDAERDLLPIWAEVLGAPDMGVTDDFFLLGGHSLKAVELVAAIRRKLGHALPLGTLYQAPTVEAFARVLQQKLEAGADSALVPLQTTGARPPLFMVAGVGGHVFAFHKFARLLGADQPVYGVKAIGVDGSRRTPETVEEIAAEYVREIRMTCPRGPYILSGYSLGAVLAFEACRQLRAIGEEVPLLVAFDAAAPGYLRYSVLRRAKLHFQNLFLRGGGVGYLRQRFRNLRDRLNWLTGRAHRNAPTVAGLEMYSQDAITNVWVALHRAYKKYQPPGQFDGQIFVVRADVVDDWDKFVGGDPLLGWGEWCTGRVNAHGLPIRHLDLFHEPAISDLARLTGEAIAQALSH